MNRPKKLIEYSDKELANEANRRINARNRGVCDYCKRTPDTTPCRFPVRHHSRTVCGCDEVKKKNGSTVFFRCWDHGACNYIQYKSGKISTLTFCLSGNPNGNRQ